MKIQQMVKLMDSQTPEEGEDTPADEPEELDPSLTAFGIWRWIMAFHR